MILSAYCARLIPFIVMIGAFIRQRKFSHQLIDGLAERSTCVSTDYIRHLKFDMNNRLLFIGSCFTEAMSADLLALKFSYVYTNPHGIVFNPLSISMCLNDIVKNREFDADRDLFSDRTHPDIVHSWQHHSSFSGHVSRKTDIVDRMNNRVRVAREAMIAQPGMPPSILFLTFGSAFCHRLIETGEVVANCHKQPSSLFNKELLSCETIVESLSQSIAAVRELNPLVKIVFTVSPVRHTREGMTENSRSKATLICASHILTERFDNTYYFPAYEILMDELRDYRWYTDDLIHPTAAARKIVFDKFTDTFFSDQTRLVMQEIKSLFSNMNHRPHVLESLATRAHISATIAEAKRLSDKYAVANKTDRGLMLNFSAEIDALTLRLEEWDRSFGCKI